jgi:hypothetical protein
MVGVYTEHEHAPVSFPRDYYLKPAQYGGSQMVHGALRSLRASENTDRMDIRGIQDEQTRNTGDPAIDSMERLHDSIQTLGAYLKRIAQFATWIALVLVILAIFVYETH